MSTRGCMGIGLVWLTQSETRPDIVYVVVKLTTGEWLCSCPAGSRGKLCKHIQEAKSESDAATCT